MVEVITTERMLRTVAGLEITPRLRVPSSPKSTVPSVIGRGGVNAEVTVNEMGTPTELVEADAVMATVGLTRVTTNEKAAVPRCEFKSVADATMVKVPAVQQVWETEVNPDPPPTPRSHLTLAPHLYLRRWRILG